MARQTEIRRRITDQIIEALRTGGIPPWRKGWASHGGGLPANLVSKRRYSGVIVLLLQLAAARHGFTSRYWATFNQIQALGGAVEDTSPAGDPPMNNTIDLPDAVLARAAQDFFAAEWASAREAAGFRFPPGTEITAACPAEDPATLLRLVHPHVTRLARAWGMGVGALFRLMEIPEGRWADALYYVLMGCRGHGVGLADDFGENIELAERKLGVVIDPTPFQDDFLDFYDLASEVVSAEARKPDPGPDPDAPFRPGDRVQVETRLPTGDWETGTGTVVRWTAVGDPMSAGDGAVVALDDGEQIEPWCYRGMTVFVPQGECEPMSRGAPA